MSFLLAQTTVTTHMPATASPLQSPGGVAAPSPFQTGVGLSWGPLMGLCQRGTVGPGPWWLHVDPAPSKLQHFLTTPVSFETGLSNRGFLLP